MLGYSRCSRRNAAAWLLSAAARVRRAPGRPPVRNRSSKSRATPSDQAVSRSRKCSRSPASASRSAPNSRSAPGSRYRDDSAPSRSTTDLSTRPDQRGQYLLARQRAVRAHLLGAAHVERPGEDRQPLPQRPLGRAAQPVAPLHRGPQRLVPRAGAAAADRQQRPDRRLQLAGQLRQRQRAQPHRGELDRERDAVEPPAQPHDVRPVLRRDGEPGHDRRRALRRTADRVAPRPGSGSSGKACSPGASSGCLLVASRVTPGAAAQHGVGERRAGVDQVLAGVQDEQQLPAPQVSEDAPASTGAWPASGTPERRGDRVGHQGGVADGAQVGEPDAVRVLARRPRPRRAGRSASCPPRPGR